MRATDLPEDLYGAHLKRVHELLFVPAGGPSPAMREAVALDLGGRSIVVEALTDTSELSVSLGSLEPQSSEHHLRDASADRRFRAFVGQSLKNWWVAENDRGYTDLFLVGFGSSQGLLFVAINNVVSVLTVSGEQLA